MTKTIPPRVTVLIPCYNYAAYVGDAIQSVLRQDYGAIELIVIDDGSTDASWEVISRLAAEHGFTAIRNANQGLIATVREGMARASGTYFSSLNADDRKLPHAVSCLVALMERDRTLGVAGGACYLIGADGKRTGEVRTRSVVGGLEELLLRRAHLCAPTLMFRKEALAGEKALDPRFMFDDLQMALFVANGGWRVAVVKEFLGEYRLHGANMSGNLYGEYDAVCRLYQEYAGSSVYKQARGVVANRYARAAALRRQWPTVTRALADLRSFGASMEFKTALALFYGRLRQGRR